MSNDKQSIIVRADAARRAMHAWQLRVSGLPWDEVATQAGFSNAPNALRAVRNWAGRLPQLTHTELREVARERAEWLWRKAAEDVEDRRPGAVRAAVATLQRQAALDGLDAAHRIEVDVDAAELERIARQIQAARGMTPIEADVLELDVLEE
jgi:hypothetical protein